MDARYSFETLISAEALAAKVEELGKTITRDYKDKDTVFVGILKGSFIFMADLVRQVQLDRLEICFMIFIPNLNSGHSELLLFVIGEEISGARSLDISIEITPNSLLCLINHM